MNLLKEVKGIMAESTLYEIRVMLSVTLFTAHIPLSKAVKPTCSGYLCQNRAEADVLPTEADFVSASSFKSKIIQGQEIPCTLKEILSSSLLSRLPGATKHGNIQHHPSLQPDLFALETLKVTHEVPVTHPPLIKHQCRKRSQAEWGAGAFGSREL